MNIAEQVDAQIANAQNQAENSVPATTQQGQPPAPANENTTHVPQTLEDLTAGAMLVDGYVKVDEHGVHFDDNRRSKIDEFRCKIDLSQIQGATSIRYGNPPTYVKTYDGKTTSDGQSWAEAYQQALSVDPKVKPYPSADIPMELIHEVKQGKDNVYEAGTLMGHSTSPTNRNELAKFHRQVKAAGLEDETVIVKVSWKERSNAHNTWGVLTFTLEGAADE